MNVQLKPSKYVVAVSGGVDSVALLDLLRQVPEMNLVVAHFDHGMRTDSAEDRYFVNTLADNYGLPFEYADGQLGSGASEAAARAARYNFLRKVREHHKANAIVTAHHQDDVLETAIINLLRGTGRKGLSSLNNRESLERPLLHVPKREIITYARKNNLQWREDSTNTNEKYLRNYVRHQILPRFNTKARAQLLEIIRNSTTTNHEIDTLLVKYLPIQSGNFMQRQQFNNLPDTIAREVMAAWLRRQGVRDFDSQTLERLVVAAKTAPSNSQFDVKQSHTMKVGRHDLALSDTER